MESEYMIYLSKRVSLIICLILLSLSLCWQANAEETDLKFQIKDCPQITNCLQITDLKTQIKMDYNVGIEETTEDRARISSSEMNSFLQSFQKEAQSQKLSRSPIEIKVVVYEENWNNFQLGTSNFFGDDIEFVSSDRIEVGSESAEAAVNMLQEQIDSRDENDEDF